LFAVYKVTLWLAGLQNGGPLILSLFGPCDSICEYAVLLGVSASVGGFGLSWETEVDLLLCYIHFFKEKGGGGSPPFLGT
jgi:hypothetical protein